MQKSNVVKIGVALLFFSGNSKAILPSRISTAIKKTNLVNLQCRRNGPVTGAAFYWATKTLCYGTAVGATTAVTFGTGGTVNGMLAGAWAATNAATATTIGATAVGAAIQAVGLTGAALEATTAVVATSGSLATAAAVVETASLAAGAVGTSLWFLP